MVDSTERFSDRVADYVRSRPGYPPAFAAWLREVASLTSASRVADLGSGTGISTAMLLSLGCEVFAVEPNASMRAAAEATFAHAARFHSVAGTAEATGLPEGSIDLVAAGQAFHWFDVTATRRECRRILRPGGRVALFWNVRRETGAPFLEGYEALLRRHGTDYLAVRHQANPERIDAFFAGPYERREFPNEQVLDYDGLQGRLLSSSYVPSAGDAARAPMLAELRRLFDDWQRDGGVRLIYDTRVFIGALAGEDGAR